MELLSGGSASWSAWRAACWPSPTCCCSTSPTTISTWRARRCSNSHPPVRRHGGDHLARPLPAGRDGQRIVELETGGGGSRAAGRATTRPMYAEGAGAAPAAAGLRHPAERDRAPGGGDRALQAVGCITLDHARTRSRRDNKQRLIDRMDKVEKPVLERRKMALELPRARGGAKASSCATWTSPSGTSPS